MTDIRRGGAVYRPSGACRRPNARLGARRREVVPGEGPNTVVVEGRAGDLGIGEEASIDVFGR
jgi:hypothetical protein